MSPTANAEYSKIVWYHLLAVILTVIVSRTILWLAWSQSWMTSIKEDSWHHAYTGILIWVAARILLKKFPLIKMIFLGVGMGLFLDEIILLLRVLRLYSGTTIGYWDTICWITAVCSTGIYSVLYLLIARKQLYARDGKE